MDESKVLDWLRTQGYWLEHATAQAARESRFTPVLGRTYRDDSTGKLREIDVLAAANPHGRTPALSRLVVFECKAGNEGAWIARCEVGGGQRPSSVLATSRASAFLAERPSIVRMAFPGSRPAPFAVVLAGKVDSAFNAVQQARSAARGVLGNLEGSAVVHPVVVIAAPLYSLVYEGDEPKLAVEKWTRLPVASGHDSVEVIAVDIVTRDALSEYLRGLWDSLDELSSDMLSQGWSVDE